MDESHLLQNAKISLTVANASTVLQGSADFQVWSMKMRASLRGAGLLHTVQGLPYEERIMNICARNGITAAGMAKAEKKVEKMLSEENAAAQALNGNVSDKLQFELCNEDIITDPLCTRSRCVAYLFPAPYLVFLRKAATTARTNPYARLSSMTPASRTTRRSSIEEPLQGTALQFEEQREGEEQEVYERRTAPTTPAVIGVTRAEPQRGPTNDEHLEEELTAIFQAETQAEIDNRQQLMLSVYIFDDTTVTAIRAETSSYIESLNALDAHVFYRHIYQLIGEYPRPTLSARDILFVRFIH